MASFDIEYMLEQQYVKGLRAIFVNDNTFIYNKDDRETKLVITTDYPQTDAPFKIPHLLITGIGFQLNLQETFSNNIYSDVTYQGIVNGSQKYKSIIPYNITLMCLGEYNVCKDAANKLIYYVSFAAYEYLSTYLHLNIHRAVKSPTVATKQFPEKVFETAVNIEGHLEFSGTRVPFYPADEGYLKTFPLNAITW